MEDVARPPSAPGLAAISKLAVGRPAVGRVTPLANVSGRALQVLPATQGWYVLTAEALFVIPAGA